MSAMFNTMAEMAGDVRLRDFTAVKLASRTSNVIPAGTEIRCMDCDATAATYIADWTPDVADFMGVLSFPEVSDIPKVGDPFRCSRCNSKHARHRYPDEDAFRAAQGSVLREGRL